jgi:hypothetical protein
LYICLFMHKGSISCKQNPQINTGLLFSILIQGSIYIFCKALVFIDISTFISCVFF